MKSSGVYYESFGCQMNAFDTEVIASIMAEEGYREVSSPDEADIIIVNTCSVREHAERRALGRLNDLSRHRDALLVVCGCMAQRMGKRLFELVPSLAIVAGTDTYDRLPKILAAARESGEQIALLDRDDTVTYAMRRIEHTGPCSRYLSITRGCANYCTYCIVPYLRGEVRSKDPSNVVATVQKMTASGTREVTLLGQNVMAYRFGDTDFPSLLGRVLNETGILRLRFLTSHPRDLTDRIFHLMADDERLCPHIHLPVQAGSNRILGLMGRGYSREHYIDIVARAREIVPGLAVTTDIIVGFPTETDAEFRETIDLVERVGFDAAFTFKYSPREGTAAAGMKDDVGPEEKRRRLRILNETIENARRDTLSEQLGTETEILLDGRVQKGEYEFWKGRTPHFRNVLVNGKRHEVGDIVPVRLKSMLNFTFIGEEPIRR
ncbi:MAG: tRNA (N6-isopentenyl adenosine(37)-C2)-methylthiotransferase MiaB [bacterium]|nr:MAG: tRNA (N6-isopentenyl adenosine(37)-C2)-methylthiotransferase MiaB [bacterium]